MSARYPGCEANEVPIATLPIGAAFEIDLGTRIQRGVILASSPGSITVELDNVANLHWCIETAVIPAPVGQDVQQWLQKSKPIEKDNGMNSKKQSTKKAAGTEKSEGRRPALAQYTKEAFEMHGSYKGKDVTAKVAADGMITVGGKQYTSPSEAGSAFIGGNVNGWKFWHIGKGEDETTIDFFRTGKKAVKKPVAEPKKKAEKKTAKKGASAKASSKKAEAKVTAPAAAAFRRRKK